MKTTREEELAFYMEQFQRRAREELAKVAADLTAEGFGKAEYRLRWLADLPRTVQLARMAELTLGAVAEVGFEKGLQGALTNYERELENWRPHRSTSPYANAANDELHEALREFLPVLRRLAQKEA